jgi:hypothetical protein
MSETIYEVLDRIEPGEPEPIMLGPSATSLDLLQAVYRDPRQPISRRLRAGIAALPFEHPKLAVTAVVSTEGFAAKLEAARGRAARVIEYRPGEASAPEILEPIRR